MSNKKQRTLDIPLGPTNALRNRLAAKRRDYAAYLLDRADQYATASPCWIALSDAAHNVMLGEVEAAKASGDLDAGVYKRVDSWRDKKLRKVVPALGAIDGEDV